MKVRKDILDAIQEMSKTMSHRAILKELGLPESYRGYMTPMFRGGSMSADRQDEFAEALGLPPSLRRRYYRPTMAKEWRALFDELGMSVDDIVASWVFSNRPDLWYMVPTAEEKGK